MKDKLQKLPKKLRRRLGIGMYLSTLQTEKYSNIVTSAVSSNYRLLNFDPITRVSIELP